MLLFHSVFARLVFGAFFLFYSCLGVCQISHLLPLQLTFFESVPSLRLPGGVAESSKQHTIAHTKHLRYCVDPDWLPHERITPEGRHEGIFADFVALIGNRVGVELSLFPTSTWSDTITAARAGECDFISGINITPERQGYFYFSEPYLVAPMVIVTRDSWQNIDGLQDLAGMSLASVADYRIAEIVQQQYPNIHLQFYPNIGEALLAVSSGNADAAVGSILGMSYNVVQLSLVNLKLAAHTEFKGEYRIALNADNPSLLRAINNAIASITAQQKKDIISRWVVLLDEKRIDYNLVIKVLVFAVFIIAALVYRQWIIHQNNAALARVNTELKHAWQKAEQASEAKSQFLANISHELRTPMTGLIASLDLLGISDLDKKQLQLISSMQVAAQSQLTLLNHLLDSSRANNGNMKLDSVEFQLKEALEQVLCFIEPKALQKGLSITSALALSESLVVKGDPQAIRQVVLNLLNNAVKFSNQGEVKLSARVLEEGEREICVQIGVQDSGPGIDKAHHSKVFEPFYQVPANGLSPVWSKEPGTGLGLSICVSLLTLMKSRLQLQSNTQPSKGETGSVFSFELTLPKIPLTSTQKAAELTVILLEDEALHQELVRFQLEKNGHSCIVICEVDQVKAVLQKEGTGIDVILADWRFYPSVKQALGSCLRGDAQSHSMPQLVLMSSDVRPAQMCNDSSHPMIKKPFSWQKLLETGVIAGSRK